METCSEFFFFFTHHDKKRRDKRKNECKKELKNKMMLQKIRLHTSFSLLVKLWVGVGVERCCHELSLRLLCSLLTCITSLPSPSPALPPPHDVTPLFYFLYLPHFKGISSYVSVVS